MLEEALGLLEAAALLFEKDAFDEADGLFEDSDFLEEVDYFFEDSASLLLDVDGLLVEFFELLEFASSSLIVVEFVKVSFVSEDVELCKYPILLFP